LIRFISKKKKRGSLYSLTAYVLPTLKDMVKVKVKVKQFHYRPGQALRVPES
jgi:hypothetical protein